MSESINKFASESTHWYTRDGEPMHEIVGKNGQIRNTTLRDARKLNLLPSVTSILSVVSKPGLDAWKQRTILEAALTEPIGEDEDFDTYVDKIVNEYQRISREARDLGSKIHSAIAKYIKPDESIIGLDLREYTQKAMDWWGENMAMDGHVEESFASPAGYAGCIDLEGFDADGEWRVVDWKTCSRLPRCYSDCYPEHACQLAAYATGSKNGPAIWLDKVQITQLTNVYICTNGKQKGEIYVQDWKKEDNMEYLNAFLAAKAVWGSKLCKDYKV